MRIFYAAHAAGDASITGSRTWARNLLSAFRDLGHEVITFDYDLDTAIRFVDPDDPVSRAYAEMNRPRASDELVRQVGAAHAHGGVDLFFSYFYSAMVEPTAIRDVSLLGIPTVNWYCNASYQFHLVEEIAPSFDVCLVPERFRLDDYRRVGANPVYCQEAANPLFYKPVPGAAPEIDVAFVGQRYGDRPALVKHLVDDGIDVRVWGNGWQPAPGLVPRLRRTASWCLWPGTRIPRRVLGPPLDDDAYVAMYSRSRVSLGFSKVPAPLADGTVVRQVRLRDFEAPMSGAFYLLEHSDEIEDFFVPGQEIVTFEGQGDLLDKARYYLEHEGERERIRLAGHERALREHTWQVRLSDAFRRAGLPGW